MKKYTTGVFCLPQTASALLCVFLLAGLENAYAQPQSNQVTDAASQGVKAYKTLNFGDNTETVEHKLSEIVAGGKEDVKFPEYIDHGETFWRALFDTDAEYEPYKYNATLSSQSEKLQSLMLYFKQTVGIDVLSFDNDAFSVICYELNGKNSPGNGGLAVVEVSYQTFDLAKLVDGFMQNYPNAGKENKSYKIESTTYPGVFLEFERTYFLDINPERRATLSIPTGTFTFQFTEPSKLSKEQLAVWQRLMAQNDKADVNEYFASVKASLSGAHKRHGIAEKFGRSYLPGLV